MEGIQVPFFFLLQSGDLLQVMCERAGFQQGTNLILYEVYCGRGFMTRVLFPVYWLAC